jgi:hypothetical protein
MGGPAVERAVSWRFRAGARAAQAGADAGHDLGRIEGLDDVVVGAEFQPGDPVLHLRPARDDDDRRPGFQRQPMHQRQPVAVRQAQIDKADIGRGGVSARPRTRSRGRRRRCGTRPRSAPRTAARGSAVRRRGWRPRGRSCGGLAEEAARQMHAIERVSQHRPAGAPPAPRVDVATRSSGQLQAGAALPGAEQADAVRRRPAAGPRAPSSAPGMSLSASASRGGGLDHLMAHVGQHVVRTAARISAMSSTTSTSRGRASASAGFSGRRSVTWRRPRAVGQSRTARRRAWPCRRPSTGRGPSRLRPWW